jgi:hypothetical protein
MFHLEEVSIFTDWNFFPIHSCVFCVCCVVCNACACKLNYTPTFHSSLNSLQQFSLPPTLKKLTIDFHFNDLDLILLELSAIFYTSQHFLPLDSGYNSPCLLLILWFHLFCLFLCIPHLLHKRSPVSGPLISSQYFYYLYMLIMHKYNSRPICQIVCLRSTFG